MKAWGFKLSGVNTEIFDELNYDNSSDIAEGLMADFQAKKYDKIILVYNQFKNAAVQILQPQRPIPVRQSSRARAWCSSPDHAARCVRHPEDVKSTRKVAEMVVLVDAQAEAQAGTGSVDQVAKHRLQDLDTGRAGQLQ